MLMQATDYKRWHLVQQRSSCLPADRSVVYGGRARILLWLWRLYGITGLMEVQTIVQSNFVLSIKETAAVLLFRIHGDIIKINSDALRKPFSCVIQ